ncbi:MAG: DHH family phosphoesterase [Clostridiales Family XIII bacterium]|jgi:c-di-AMP phosphodiesterase-like protein|nr:DHH family phosphoesterase [Clostridiales Family XIII bacterium]
MGEKLIKKLTAPYLAGIAAVLLCLIAALFFFGLWAGIGALLFGVLLSAYFLSLWNKQKKWLESYLEGVEDEIDQTLRYSMKFNPLPFCIVGEDEKIVLANSKFRELYPETQILKTEIKRLTGKSYREFLPDETGNPMRLTVNEKIYKVLPAYFNGELTKSVILYWVDVTNYESLKTMHNNERKCFARVHVDNYDELISSSPDEKKSLVAANIDAAVRQWGGSISASVTKYSGNKYLIVFENSHFERLIKEKFAILNTVRDIETDADFPVSLSIGVGADGKTPQETDEFAAFALDLALGRGGDQAVVKRNDSVSYYGGRLQIVERRDKGKSRVLAHALSRLIDQSSRVIIMGHKNPDMDSFGAAVGVARVALNREKENYIVINGYNHSMTGVYEAAEKSGDYNFIKSGAALELADKDALLVVVDTHKPSLTEYPALLGEMEKKVVIDHHRKTEEFIENAILACMEPAASSTSEIIAEILQYTAGKKKLSRLEANLLLGGIIVDTNSFSVKTGARTFEAASWLRMNGADTTVVRQFLQNDMDDFRRRAAIINSAEFLQNGVAISRSEGKNSNAQILNAQAADGLLNISGVRASFVVGESDSEVLISARSLGKINVQTIMEKMGGGGHLTMAAAQVDMTVDDAISKIKELLEEAE